MNLKGYEGAGLPERHCTSSPLIIHALTDRSRFGTIALRGSSFINQHGGFEGRRWLVPHRYSDVSFLPGNIVLAQIPVVDGADNTVSAEMS